MGVISSGLGLEGEGCKLHVYPTHSHTHCPVGHQNLFYQLPSGDLSVIDRFAITLRPLSSQTPAPQFCAATLATQVGIDSVRYSAVYVLQILKASSLNDVRGPQVTGLLGNKVKCRRDREIPRALACHGGKPTQPRSRTSPRASSGSHLDHSGGAHYTSTHSSYKLVYSSS